MVIATEKVQQQKRHTFICSDLIWCTTESGNTNIQKSIFVAICLAPQLRTLSYLLSTFRYYYLLPTSSQPPPTTTIPNTFSHHHRHHLFYHHAPPTCSIIASISSPSSNPTSLAVFSFLIFAPS